MTLYDLKPAFQRLLNPIVVALHRRNVTANQVTPAALFLSRLTGILLALFPYPVSYCILPLVLLLRMALNAIDGMLARQFNQQSRLGAILNEIGDVLSDVALYLPFALLPGASPWLVLLVVVLAVLSEFFGLLTQTLTGQRDYKGPLGKSDRALLFGAYALCLVIWPIALSVSPWLFAAAALLLIWTCVNRYRTALP